MNYIPKTILDSEEVIIYASLSLGLINDKAEAYCKDCGCYLKYDGADIHILKRVGRTVNEDGSRSERGKVVHEGLSFLSLRIYNGNVYRLCRCRQCVENKFPSLKTVKYPYNSKAAKYTLYAFNVPDEDFKSVSKERQLLTLLKMVKKYGLEVGLLKWDEYCLKLSYTNSFDYKHEKYGMTKLLFNKYNKSRAVTLENLVKRYGKDDGLLRWNDYIERQRFTCSKEYFILEYGEDVGLKKFNDYCDKRNSAYKSLKRVSDISLLLFNKLYELYKDHEVYYGENEYKVKNDNSVYFVDYYDKTLNIVIEFYGDYWHMNPLKYRGDDILRNLGVKAYDVWNHDKQRLEDILRVLNCLTIIVWESEFRSDMEAFIHCLYELINRKTLHKISTL